jgi:CRISPR-associated endonuclease/helicase Cas3
MAYHSQQVLLLRSAQEKHLDKVLKRQDPQAAFNIPQIRQHLHESPASNVIFILVATPVEEVGRDHDFDWAVVEPSSYRSIIQLAGRVLRHRDLIPKTANMALMQFNLKALNKQKPAYYRPGYESEHFRLASHDLKDLIPNAQLTCINAVPRIQKNIQATPDKNLADLEHASIQRLLTSYQSKGPQTLQGWLTECWWLTAMPQRLSPFRQQDGQLTLYLVPDDKKDWALKEKTPKGDLIDIDGLYKIEHDQALPSWHKKLWLYRDYGELLSDVVERNKENGGSMTINYAALRYGEISVPVYGDELLTGKGYVYSNQLGLCKKVVTA